MRSLLFTLAAVAGGYAIVAWIVGFVADAGLAGAIATTAWLIAYIIGQWQHEQMRHDCEQTTATRSHGPVGEA
ncbi:hypothetical protein ACQI5H_20230 [Mycobacterium heidelbergense]|uniref:hypothetical protein n=1 Tax=Mycobacterium heidelbergense TaxID=53376 RepID=UPI003CF909D1